MASAGSRIGIVGATGALGSEVLAALDASSLRVREILPVATDRSLGQEIEFAGELYPVACDAPSLHGLDLVFVCAPPAASLEWVRAALRAAVPCIDLAGSLSASGEVPLLAAGFARPPEAEASPVVAAPGGAALAWARVLQPLDAWTRLVRVTGALLDAASAGGREGIESLYGESLAIFNQRELPEPDVFGAPVAFDCLPDPGRSEGGDQSPREERLVGELARLLGGHVRLGIQALQVPAFVGHGSALWIEGESELDPERAEAVLAKAPGVEIWQGPGGPNVRAAAGRDVVLASRPRRDPSAPGALRLWLVADALCLAACNAVELAVARLRAH